MDDKTKRVLESLKFKKVGVFGDDSNLYYSYKNYGWRIDFEKLKKLLEGYCDLKFINYHIAIPDKSDVDYRGVQNFIRYISPFVVLKKKALKYTPITHKHILRKGDVDVEIVLDVVRTIDDLDLMIIMSGDSDYLELKNYVVKDKAKKIIFMGYEENMAWELRQCWHIYTNRIKDIIGLNAKK